jgi:exonuclease III
VADDLQGLDRSVLAHLEAAGWIDLGYRHSERLDPARIATVPTPAYRTAEFATMRCDYLLASAALAAKARTCEVIRNDITDRASDHYPVLAIFDV